VAAGVALVTAAGGHVRTLDGSPLVFNQERPWLSGLAAYPPGPGGLAGALARPAGRAGAALTWAGLISKGRECKLGVPLAGE
jgi:hypothetical protein